MEPPVTADDDADEREPDLAALAERLEHARFTIAFRGFEPKEVHELLAEVAEKLRRSSSTEITPGEGTLEAAGARNLAVARARHEAAEIVEAARTEAERLIAEAERDATNIRDEARATFLKGIRDANALVQRAQRDSAGNSPH